MKALLYDVAVIGAGVVGCAMARRFTLEGARVIVLEKAADFLDGAKQGQQGNHAYRFRRSASEPGVGVRARRNGGVRRN